MNTTNLLSKLVKSNKSETVEGLNKALESIGVKQISNGLSNIQAKEIGKLLVEKLAGIGDLKSIAESIKESVSVEELERFKSELNGKLSAVTYSSRIAPVYEGRLDTLKSSLEEVSGDDVL